MTLSRLFAGKAILIMQSKIVILLSTFLTILIFSRNAPFKLGFENSAPTQIRISAVGDLMCHSPEYEYARAGKDSFNFNFIFNSVKPILEKSDFAVGNLETVLAGKEKKYSGYPKFNSPSQFLDAVKDAGFDFLFTSNNHCLDRGKEGILSTLNQIKLRSLKSTGTFSSQKEKDSVQVIILNGVKIVFLAYTQMLNGASLSKENSFLVNRIDTNNIRNDISRAKKQDVDLVIVYFHFGEEYKREPVPYQREIVKKTISAGADIILASHPHVLERIETFKPVNSKLDTGFVAYSLGNFISNQRWRYSDAGTILNFTLEKDAAGNIMLKNIEIVPTWVFRGKVFTHQEFVVIPSAISLSDKPLFYLKPADLKKMKESFFDSRDILLKNIKLDKSKISVGGQI